MENPQKPRLAERVETKTERLNFRFLKVGDEQCIFPEVDEDLTKYWIGWEPAKSIKEERKVIQEKVEATKHSPNFEFIAFDHSDNFIGCCSITPSEEHGEFELGLWVKHSEQGKGYGKEMLSMIIDWAKKNTDLPYLIYSFTEGNEASAAIIKKMGVPLFRKVVYQKRGMEKQVYDYKIMLK